MGMKGGTVLVKGNAGERVGDHLRRGMILIEGNADGLLRFTDDRPGTIAVMGVMLVSILGYAMRRDHTSVMRTEPQICRSHF